MDAPLSSPRRALGCLVLLLLGLGPAAPVAAQDPAAQRLLLEAERLEQAGDTSAALAELTLLVRQFPGDRLAPRALLRIARLHRARGERQSAEKVLAELVGDHARSAEAAQALCLQAELTAAAARGSEDLSAAQNGFRRVALLYGREAYPALDARREARIRSGEIALLLGDPASAAAELIAALEDEPPHPAAGRARLGLARAWIAAGEVPAAAALAEELATADAKVSAAADRAAARRLLSLLHRRVLRPLAGQHPWLASGRYPPSGLDLREPSGVAAAPDGRLLVVDERLPAVVLLDAGGREAARQALDDVAGPGWLTDGRPFVTGAGGVVLPFDAESYAFNDPRRGGPLKNVLAAAGGVFGDWFVAAKGAKSLLHVAADGQARELLAALRPEVVDVARGGAGRVYALDARNDQVLRLDSDGGETVVAGGDWRKPAALAADELGYLYVLDRGQRRVDLFAPGGELMAQVGPDLGGGIELRNPVDVAVDGGGRLFIADSKLPFVVMLD